MPTASSCWLPTCLLLLQMLGACSSGRGSDRGSDNQLVDSDGNGHFDTARSVQDWDRDGELTLRDVQAAIDALSDPGPKRVELAEGATFRPIGMLTIGANAHGLVELPSNTTLDCEGAVLEGIDPSQFSLGGWPPLLATLTNADHFALSNHDIHIRNCVVTGGMPTSYDGARFPHHTYMGIALIGVNDASIRDGVVRNTHHACIYLKNAVDVLVQDNEMHRCGAVGNQHPLPTQPAVYLFQAGPRPTERITVRGNSVFHAGNALYNTRIGERNGEYQTAWLREILFESNYGEDDDSDYCFYLRGAREVRVRGNVCRATSGIELSHRNDNYCSKNPPATIDGESESSCVENIDIEDNSFIENRPSNSNGVISIHPHHDGIRLRRNSVIRTSGGATPSLRIRLPVRGLLIEDLELEDCAGNCVQVEGPPQRNVPPGEYLTLRRVVANGAGLHDVYDFMHPCFYFPTRLEGLLAEQITASRCSGTPVWFDAGLSDSVLSAFEIDGLPPGFLRAIDLSLSSLPECDASAFGQWIFASGSDGSCSGGPGSQEAICVCEEGVEWRPWQPGVRPGLRIDASEGLLVEDGWIKDVDGFAGLMLAAPGAHDADLRRLHFDQPRLGAGVRSPMSRGVWDVSAGGTVRTDAVTCEPGAVAGSCLDL